MAFTEGRSGNKGGRPKGIANKVTRDVRQLAQNLFDPAYWKRTKGKLLQGKLHPVLERTLLAYAYGEPKKTLKLEGEVSLKQKRSVLRNLPEEVVQQLVAAAAFDATDGKDDTVN